MSAAIAAVAIGGALIASSASQNAASTEADAANNASRVQQNQYTQSRADVQPWLDSGQKNLSQLNQQMPDLTRKFSMADFQADPGYQFNLQQGQQAIERSAAARGGLNSGATMKSLAGFSQGLANSTYDDAFNRFNTNQGNTFNRLATMSGMGQSAANTNAATGQATAAAIGNNIASAGNAQAAGQIATGNNINSAIGTGMNTWMGNQMLNRFSGTPSTPSSMSPTTGWSPQQLTMPTPSY